MSLDSVSGLHASEDLSENPESMLKISLVGSADKLLLCLCSDVAGPVLLSELAAAAALVSSTSTIT